MHNPFAKPHTPGQWLLGSLGLLVSTVGSWLALNMVSSRLPQGQNSYDLSEALCLGCFLLGLGLLYLKGAVNDGQLSQVRPRASAWFLGIAFIGRTLLIMIGLYMLALLIIGLLFALGGPMTF